MDGSAFRVRGDTCTRVTAEISALKLHKNEDGGYAYDDALIFEKQIERVFERQYYESSSDGMKGLLAKPPQRSQCDLVDQVGLAPIGAQGFEGECSQGIHLHQHGGARNHV